MNIIAISARVLLATFVLIIVVAAHQPVRATEMPEEEKKPELVRLGMTLQDVEALIESTK